MYAIRSYYEGIPVYLLIVILFNFLIWRDFYYWFILLDFLVPFFVFLSSVYVTPIFGGILADKVLGQRKSIYIGGLTMAIGQFLLASSAWLHGADTALEIV